VISYCSKAAGCEGFST